jgi:spore maturation protein CgeB
MKLVIFGLTISSSWGNGHATLWRGLVRALARDGHRVVFYERDVPYYAQNRDLWEIPNGELVLYGDWADIADRAERDLDDADAAMVTSFCPDGIAATDLVCDAARPVRVFYDLDTPVTLSALRAGETTSYIGPDGFAGFDLVLSYTGGAALDALRDDLGARRAETLYGHVDPDFHRPEEPVSGLVSDLSYLGTYAADRQPALEALFVGAARQRPNQRFLIGGAQYPQNFPWTRNIYFLRHVPPDMHPAFFASSRLTLNITRKAMAEMGWCPSGRLFEAAACGVPILSDTWPGLEDFFTPGDDILVASTTDEALNALGRGDAELTLMAARARDRVLAHHTSAIRARELIDKLHARPATRRAEPALYAVAGG